MGVKSLCWIAVFFAVLAAVRPLQPPPDPDEERDAIELIKSRGFEAEQHFVTTEDGYILQLHRVVNPKLPKHMPKRPVLLQHGLFGSSDDFLINSPGYLNQDGDYVEPCMDANVTREIGGNRAVIGNTVAFVLSQFGYDVWLGNARGNYYSRNHTYWNPSQDNEFWEYSFDQMAEYDLPAAIEYILTKTGRPTLGYIGFSQGSQTMFALMSQNPRYQKVVKPFIAIAPVTFMANIKSALRHLLFLRPFYEWARAETNARPGDRDPVGRFLCRNLIFRYLCALPNELMEPGHILHINMSRLSVYKGHEPSGTSFWNIGHLAQLVDNNRFSLMSFNEEINKEKYGQSESPDYFLEHIQSPWIALIYSKTDQISTVEDIETLKSKLKGKLLDDYVIPDTSWSHGDYLQSNLIGKFVNTRIIDVLRRAEGGNRRRKLNPIDLLGVINEV